VTFHRYMGSGANGYSMDDFNADNFDHTGLDFIGGGVISCGASGARPIQSLPVPPGTPTWGAQWKAAIRKYYDRVISVGMQGESIAYRTHFLDLDPTYRDVWGQPLLRITFDWEDNERKMAAFGAAKIKDILQATGADTVAVNGQLPTHYDTAVYQSTHNTGGAIMGADPATSVVNNYCQMWDFANVFIVGASAFPQNAGRNPTGTVGALAYRAADGIINKRVAT
jgi:gluconate 2-dehydrogenase alpha chain